MKQWKVTEKLPPNFDVDIIIYLPDSTPIVRNSRIARLDAERFLQGEKEGWAWDRVFIAWMSIPGYPMRTRNDK